MTRRDTGSILKAKDGKRWYARLRYTDAAGKPREKKRTCANFALAKSAITQLQNEVDNELTEKKTYAELDAFYRKEYVHAAKIVGGKKVSGFRQDTRTVKRYLDRGLEFFGSMPLADITYDHCRRYKLEIEAMPARGKHRSVSDVNHHLKRVRRLFKIAIEQGWLASDPFERGGSLIIETFEVERTRVLTRDEETRLLAACDKWRLHIVPVIITAIETGMRRGELQSLLWRDVDLTGRVIRVAAANTKTLKGRLVPISARLRSTLAQLRQNQLRPNSPVFGNGDFKRAFNTACRNAKLYDVHFHDLRHTAITRMLEKGIPAVLVMKISGHTQQKTFMRYVNQTETSMREIADILDGEFTLQSKAL